VQAYESLGENEDFTLFTVISFVSEVPITLLTSCTSNY
jgi:hypothetical protein